MSGTSFTFRESKKLDPKRKIFPSLQAAQVFTIDDFVARYGVPYPNYVKIDVPGLIHEIFAGARHTFAHPALREIQVEAREHKGGRIIAQGLAPLGFRIRKRGMRLEGQLQRDLVFARDGSGASNGSRSNVSTRGAEAFSLPTP